ncbi:hypothetical protein NVIE_019540 [Nitrososphaera viennensis EN76]|uniref:Uncharacterized protein n=1 Tax=Nitrososphaera viennensis EN76 TaxID=926571 RepID=A0A060HL33_9ARCH|nr:hypothetical protein NVIE_019540 [Nitrososphaera viennensis EN76]
MLVDATGNVTITNDGTTILKEYYACMVYCCMTVETKESTLRWMLFQIALSP